MTELELYDDLKTKMDKFDVRRYQATICKNIKIERQRLYNEYAYNHLDAKYRNPYSTQSVAEFLNITHEYYRRIESFDESKPISLKLLLRIAELFDVNIEVFFR